MKPSEFIDLDFHRNVYTDVPVKCNEVLSKSYDRQNRRKHNKKTKHESSK